MGHPFERTCDTAVNYVELLPPSRERAWLVVPQFDTHVRTEASLGTVHSFAVHAPTIARGYVPMLVDIVPIGARPVRVCVHGLLALEMRRGRNRRSTVLHLFGRRGKTDTLKREHICAPHSWSFQRQRESGANANLAPTRIWRQRGYDANAVLATTRSLRRRCAPRVCADAIPGSPARGALKRDRVQQLNQRELALGRCLVKGVVGRPVVPRKAKQLELVATERNCVEFPGTQRHEVVQLVVKPL
eukprot:7387404-Prymnesium_polylepis.1